MGWTHLKTITYLKDELQREFYIELCIQKRWRTRTLREKIDSMLYERTAISKKPRQLIKQEIRQWRDDDKITPDFVFRDPYLLDQLLNAGWEKAHREKAQSLTSRQLQFLDLLKNFVLEKGNVSKRNLIESPFTLLHPGGIRGIFSQKEIDEILSLTGKVLAA